MVKINTSVILGTFLSIFIYVALGVLMSFGSGGDDFATSLGKRVVIIISIFLGGLILSFVLKPTNKQIQEEKQHQNEFETLYKISHDLMFSAKNLKTRINDALYSISKYLNCEVISIGVYQDKAVEILGHKTNLKNITLSEKIIPSNISKQYPLKAFSCLEDYIANFFMTNEKKEFSVLKLDKNIELNTYILPIKTPFSIKPFGFFLVAFSSHKNVSDTLQKELVFLSDCFAFTTNIELKKDSIMQTHEKFYKQHNEIDEKLGVFNHVKLNKTIKIEAERHRRYLTPLSMVLFEIDDFKNISNVLTTEQTDTLKKDFITLIKDNIRNTDIFGILKDDTFSIIAANTDYQGTYVLVGKIMNKMKGYKFYHNLNLTCSFGITSYSSKDSPALFEERAYEALKKAQLKGGNNFDIQLLV